MFGKLTEFGPLIQALMKGDQSALFELARPHLPEIIRSVVAGAVQSAGGDPLTDAAFVWLHNGTIMATVYHRTALDEPGEVIATVDLLDRLAVIDLKDLIK